MHQMQRQQMNSLMQREQYLGQPYIHQHQHHDDTMRCEFVGRVPF